MSLQLFQQLFVLRRQKSQSIGPICCLCRLVLRLCWAWGYLGWDPTRPVLYRKDHSQLKGCSALLFSFQIQTVSLSVGLLFRFQYGFSSAIIMLENHHSNIPWSHSSASLFLRIQLVEWHNPMILYPMQLTRASSISIRAIKGHFDLAIITNNLFDKPRTIAFFVHSPGTAGTCTLHGLLCQQCSHQIDNRTLWTFCFWWLGRDFLACQAVVLVKLSL